MLSAEEGTQKNAARLSAAAAASSRLTAFPPYSFRKIQAVFHFIIV
jgi:hypothetical protein